MPITYRIDPGRNLVLTHAVGVLTDDDILIHKRQLAADPRYGPEMPQLSDVRGITDLRVTPEGVRSMVEMDSQLGPVPSPHRMAIVVGEDLVFGMARMYEILSERQMPGVRVFRDYEKAANWLGVDSATGDS